jgi:leucyl aminopeptidase
MEIIPVGGDLNDLKTEVLIIFGFKGETPKEVTKPIEGIPSEELVALLDADFRGRKQEVIPMITGEGSSIGRIVVLGLGGKAGFGLDGFRKAGAYARKHAEEKGYRELAMIPPSLSLFPKQPPERKVQAFVEGFCLSSYKFTQLKSTGGGSKIERVRIYVGPDVEEPVAQSIGAAEIVSECVTFARDLGNMPGNVLTPVRLAEEASVKAEEFGLSCTILGPKEIEELGMGAFLGVARGSCAEPRFIILEYAPSDAKVHVALVGKAITFDSGGITLKPGANMREMKADMLGGAAVLGAAMAAARAKLPVKVTGLVPAAENMPGGDAQRPGDVVRAVNGKTVEIISTDAEGRLLLADALAYTSGTVKPDFVVDIATLTGACMVALGYEAAGLFTVEESLRDLLALSGELTGDRVWPMPLLPEYRAYLRSDVADIKNSGIRYGGACTAATFLKEFAGDIPWAHVDMAGTGWEKKEFAKDKDEYFVPKGPTGFGVALLFEFLRLLIQ